MNELKIGTENTVCFTVSQALTAFSMQSGTLEVLATPAVSAFMEKAACELVQPSLAEGMTTVGTMISLEHLSASPVGAEITAKAVLTAVDGRKYSFDIFAYDKAGLIAQGKHERFSIYAEKFMQKTQSKFGKE